MKIKKIELFNIGPYINQNTFDLSINKNKNIVLIGGKNGAGKTTFFKSIKTCLYGCRVWGFDAPGKEYYNVIDSIVNAKTQYSSEAKAYVEIELFFDDGKQKNIYTLHREWKKQNKAFIEEYIVCKDGVALDLEQQNDFNNYLLSIIPPDMFNFYFFDGESIADYFLGNEGGKNFRNAFLKLYGLDTLSLMIENFERYFKKKDGKNSTLEDYSNCKNLFEIAEQEYNALLLEHKDLENRLDLLHIKLESLQKDYIKEGGVSLVEWKELNAELLKEESKREELNRWLKEVANNYLPFIILKKEIQLLSENLNEGQEIQKTKYVKEIVSKNVFIKKLEEYLDANNSNIDSNNIIKFICNTMSDNKESDVIFDFSMKQIQRVLSQIEDKQSFCENDIIKSIKDIDNSLQKSKKIREKLFKSSIDGFGEFSEQKELFEKELSSIELLIEKNNQAIQQAEIKLELSKNSFEKAKINYEGLLKSKSINEISTRAIAAYTLLEDKLVLRQGKILQDEFIKCFASIINKDNFVDGIVIDKNINIIPYKFVEVSFSEIDNYLAKNTKNGFLPLFANKYAMNINELRLGYVDSIKLPSPITSPFSQGERQVYIMSLYLALLRTSRKDIPFFIDTPFARIDSNHREKIVNEFFKGVRNQMFILSTDEEIVGKYQELINDEISNKYLLQINSYGKTSIISNKYFGEE